jgi:anti-anti-sigma regulatory factor
VIAADGFEIDVRDGLTILRPLATYLDADWATASRDAIRSSIAGRKRVVVDLSQVLHLDYFGQEALLDLVRQCPGRVTFASARDEVRAFFQLAGLGSLCFSPTVGVV